MQQHVDYGLQGKGQPRLGAMVREAWQLSLRPNFRYAGLALLWYVVMFYGVFKAVPWLEAQGMELQKAMELARAEGIKVGLIRPITLWPYPSKAIDKYASQIKGILTVEMNAGQMVEDVRLAVNGKVKVEHYGRMGGIVPTPNEVLDALKNKFDC